MTYRMPTYIRQVDDADGTLKLALKFELEPEQVAALTKGAIDPDDWLDHCCRYVWNYLQAHSVQELRRHLEFLVRAS